MKTISAKASVLMPSWHYDVWGNKAELLPMPIPTPQFLGELAKDPANTISGDYGGVRESGSLAISQGA